MYVIAYIHIYIYLGIPKVFSIHFFCFVCGEHKRNKKSGWWCVLSQGEGHKVWGNAPKKSNSATCVRFIKSTRCASKPNVFLIFGDFWGGENCGFYDF